MLHLRLIVPKGRTDAVCALLDDDVAVTNVVLLPGAARQPEGDVVLCDVAREAASDILAALADLGLERQGSIAIEHVDVSLSRAADAATEQAPGHGDDAVVWQELDRRTREETNLTWSFLVFLTLATQLAGIAVLLDSSILVVGAMVLGPEFGAVTAICFGLIRNDPARVGHALRTLVTGFLVAIIVTLACAAVARGLGWITPEMLDNHPLTGFIVRPDRWSFIVALLAGAAGVLSVTAAKSSALVGVFISVTTVPAAGNVAVAIALARWSQVSGSLSQLGVNIAGMVISGTLTLLVQRAIWRAGSGRRRTRTPGIPPTPRG